MRNCAALTVLVLAAACGGGNDGTGPDPDPDPDPNGGNRTLSATINGSAFTATLVSGTYFNGTFTVNGVNGNRSITISAVNLNGAGTYPLNFGNQFSALAQHTDATAGNQFSTGYQGGTGTLVLTTAELGHIAGTFTFIAYTVNGTGLGMPVATVQNGSFNISVQ